MDISDALDLFNQYIVAEKGLSNQTSKSYMEDLKHFFEFYKDGSFKFQSAPFEIKGTWENITTEADDDLMSNVISEGDNLNFYIVYDGYGA